MKIKYTIIENTSLMKFEEEVENQLQRGWKLQGGVSISVYSDFYKTRYAQAMVKEQ
jgi:hypothetical protein